jgi:hypothetical protein
MTANNNSPKMEEVAGAPDDAAAALTVKEEVRVQFEFYFSDANLRHDEHLRQLLGSDPKLTGWVDLEQVASFKLVKQLLEKQSEDRLSVVRDALASSQHLEVSTDGKKALFQKPASNPSVQ